MKPKTKRAAEQQNNMSNITDILASIDSIEAYAASIETAEAESRARLLRIVRALAKIANNKQRFRRMPMRFQDEDGHYDNSFPPKQDYRDHSGPRLLEIISESTEDIATEGGFYHAWKRVTEDRGLYIAADGTLYGCEQTGTGRFGQFAAHPGNCDVDVDLSWETLAEDDVPLDRLQKAVSELIALAFPAAKDSAAAKALTA
jgi:hypothetical protein